MGRKLPWCTESLEGDKRHRSKTEMKDLVIAPSPHDTFHLDRDHFKKEKGLANDMDIYKVRDNTYPSPVPIGRAS